MRSRARRKACGPGVDLHFVHGRLAGPGLVNVRDREAMRSLHRRTNPACKAFQRDLYVHLCVVTLARAMGTHISVS
jgi:hypothetical protein